MKKISIYRVFRRSFPDKNPDWRESFNHIANLTDEEVAFEFLRRNPAYWQSLTRFYEIPDDPAEWPAGRLESYNGLGVIEYDEYERMRKRVAEEFGVWKCFDPRLSVIEVFETASRAIKGGSGSSV